jgi:eukaryotic-like serine/threonine-protein kinase
MDSLTLVSQLSETGLLPEDGPTRGRVLDLSRRLPRARDLARELIQLDLLTPYQANQILTGKARALVVGPYRLLERLGEGGMGQVFKARHLRLHRVVALKILRPDRVGNPIAVQRFYREVEVTANLSHPNVVRAYDVGEVGGLHYFAMQYVPGKDLSRFIKEHGPLPVARACDYIYQAAHGLQHIHEAGLVHRDIKPSNLMVTGSGESPPPGEPSAPATMTAPDVLKILDLGLTRLGEDTPGDPRRPALTKLGVVMGTADYMSPEQGRDSRDVDIRSDIYSLGCTFYWALTGRPPFPGGEALEKLMKHQIEEPEPIERLRPDVPPAVAAVLRRLMAKRPEDRYQTPAEAAEALEPFCLAEPPVPAVPQPVPVTPVPVTPVAPLDLTPVLLEPASVDGPLVLLRPEAVPHRGLPAAGAWTWVAATGVLIGAVLALLLTLRLFWD